MNREDIERKVFGSENETFVGEKQNADKLQAVKKLQELAKKLKSKEDWVFEVEYAFEDTGKYHKSSVVYLDFTLPNAMSKKSGAKDIFSQMSIIADEVSMAINEKGDTLRLTFTIFDLWE